MWPRLRRVTPGSAWEWELSHAMPHHHIKAEAHSFDSEKRRRYPPFTLEMQSYAPPKVEEIAEFIFVTRQGFLSSGWCSGSGVDRG